MGENLRLGVLGFGTASYEITKGLRSEGVADIHVWKREPWSDDVQARANTAGVTLCREASEVTTVSNIIISLVAPTAAPEVARQACSEIAGKFYLDLNAVSLKTKEAAAAVIQGAGGRFIDGAIMGPLKRQRHQVSTVVSGEDAAELAGALQGCGMDVRAIGTKVGLASTVKMIRSVYTKGLEAIVVEFMVAAHRFGATEQVFDSLEEILELGPFLLPFRQMVSELVLEQVEFAGRRAAEMEQVVNTMEELGVEPLMARGTLQRLRWAADEIKLRERFEGRTPSNYGEVLDVIESAAK